MNRFVATVLALIGLCAVQAACGATAVAHAELVSSSPANGAVLDGLPTDIELVFSENVGQPAALAVLDPGGNPLDTGELSVVGDTMRAPLIGGSSAAGQYTISYEVRSADGHSITGTVRFTLQGDGLEAPPEPGESTVSDANSADAQPWVVGLLTVVLVAALGLVGAATIRFVRTLDERSE